MARCNVSVCIMRNREKSRGERVCNRNAKGKWLSAMFTHMRPKHGCSHYVEKFEALTQC